MAPHGRCRWALLLLAWLLAWLPAGECGPGLTARPARDTAGSGRRPRVWPSGLALGEGGAGSGRGGEGAARPGRALFPLRALSRPRGSPELGAEPCGDEFRCPKVRLSSVPGGSGRPASWQPPGSVLCAQLGRDTGVPFGLSKRPAELFPLARQPRPLGDSWGLCRTCRAPAAVGSRVTPCPRAAFGLQSSLCPAVRAASQLLASSWK